MTSKTSKSEPQAPSEQVLRKAVQLRSAMRENFGAVALAMMALPRYRHLPLETLQHMLMEPMLADRVALARRKEADDPLSDVMGIALWASVSDEVDAKIRSQIKAGVFPVRLGPADWASGKINWLFDVMAPDAKAAAAVIGNFRQLATEGELHLHPLVPKLLDQATLEKLGVTKGEG